MFAILATLASPNASAYVYWGNPTLTVTIERSEADLVAGDVDLAGVRVHKCGGGYTDYTADTNIDPVAGWSKTISGGNLCKVQVQWDSDGQVWSNAFTLKSNVIVHTVGLWGTTSKTPWTPFSVASGSFSGSDPDVVITIQ